MHGKHTREDTLVVTVEQTTQASEASNTKDPRILDQSRGSRCTGERLTASQSGHLKVGSTTTDGSHVDGSSVGVVKVATNKSEKDNGRHEIERARTAR